MRTMCFWNKRHQVQSKYWFDLVYGVQRHLQQYFNYIVAVSFIGGRTRRTRRKPPTCRMSLTNFITKCCTPRPDRDSKSQHQG